MKTILCALTLAALSVAANLNELIQSNQNLSTFQDLMNNTTFHGVLTGNSHFIVFAPSNSAFEAVDEEKIFDIQTNPEAFVSYHIIETSTFEFSNDNIVNTYHGIPLRINTYFSENVTRITVNGAVVTNHFTADNGSLYLIDRILKPANESIENFLDKTEFSIFRSLLELASQRQNLESDGPFTLFAPTDDAFNSLSASVMNLLETNDRILSKVLQYHMASGSFFESGIRMYSTLPTLEGNIEISVQNSSVFLNDGTAIISFDNVVTNGVVHVIDKVLLPPLTLAPPSPVPMTTDPGTKEFPTDAPIVSTPTAPITTPSTEITPTSTDLPSEPTETNVTAPPITSQSAYCSTSCPFECQNVRQIDLNKVMAGSIVTIWRRPSGMEWYPDCSSNEYQLQSADQWETFTEDFYSSPLSGSVCALYWTGSSDLQDKVAGKTIRLTYPYLESTCYIQFQCA
jgi:uncharacterized surface protein with fasciclin (FAS1) repeats